jgi:hypothetical protein
MGGEFNQKTAALVRYRPFEIICEQYLVLNSKIPWYPKFLFQRENAFSLFLSAEGLGNSNKTLPGNE